MSAPDALDIAALADSLRGMGYDIEPESPGRPSGHGLIARRDQGDRVVLLAIDRAGRVRVNLSWVVGEWPAQVDVGGSTLRSVDRVSREVTLTGEVSGAEQFMALVSDLGSVQPWAGPQDVARAASAETPPPF